MVTSKDCRRTEVDIIAVIGEIDASSSIELDPGNRQKCRRGIPQNTG